MTDKEFIARLKEARRPRPKKPPRWWELFDPVYWFVRWRWPEQKSR